MTGADESDDIGADFEISQPLASLRISRFEQQGQEIAWRRLASGQQILAAADQLTHQILEEADRWLCPPAPDARHPIRQAEDIDGIDPAQTLEIAGNGTPQGIGV